MEAIWVAAEMRAGGAFAHSALALDALDATGHAAVSRPSRNLAAGTSGTVSGRD
jgi:hypothetical protein